MPDSFVLDQPLGMLDNTSVPKLYVPVEGVLGHVAFEPYVQLVMA